MRTVSSSWRVPPFASSRSRASWVMIRPPTTSRTRFASSWSSCSWSSFASSMRVFGMARILNEPPPRTQMDGGAAAQVAPGTGTWTSVDEVIGLPVGALDAERLLAAVPEAVLAVREGQVLYANAQAVALLGPAAAPGACAEHLIRGWTDLPVGGTFEGVLP